MDAGTAPAPKPRTSGRRRTSRRASDRGFSTAATGSAGSRTSRSRHSRRSTSAATRICTRKARSAVEILKTLNRFFGSAILHEITPHRIEQFKRDRLNGTWRAFKQKTSANPVKPATVNRELDTLKSILSKAVEWKFLIDSPARGVKRFKVQNRRTRILSADE